MLAILINERDGKKQRNYHIIIMCIQGAIEMNEVIVIY